MLTQHFNNEKGATPPPPPRLEKGIGGEAPLQFIQSSSERFSVPQRCLQRDNNLRVAH